MIERNNPYTQANSESLKKIINKAKKIVISTASITFAVLALTGCGRDIKDKLIKIDGDSQIPENAIVYELEDGKYFAEPNETVKFIEKTIKKQFDKDVNYEELTKKTSISIENFDSLEDIVYFINLESLRLSNSSIEDISLIKNTNIENLTLNGLSNVEDFSFIKEMKKLQELSISNCEKCNINPEMFEGLDLKELDLYFVNIKDLSFISKMNNLEKLQITGCNVKDIEVLRNLKNLTYINLSDCLISDATPLYGLTNLTQLNLSNNSIDNFDITKFPNLKSLCINSNYALYTYELLEYCEKNNINIDITKEDVECINQIRDIISKMNLEDLSIAQKEATIYSYILNNITYDKEALDDDKLALEYNKKAIYYALQGKGVCANYAAIFDAMCDIAGINAYYISGYGKTSLFSGGGHAWNLVEIDGQYMLCDPAWSDTIRDNLGYKIFNIFEEDAEKTDKYYNITNENFIKEHRENTYTNEDAPSPRSDEILNIPEEVISVITTKENGTEISGKIIAGIATGSVVLISGGAVLHYKKQKRLQRQKQERERKAREAAKKKNKYYPSYGR